MRPGMETLAVVKFCFGERRLVSLTLERGVFPNYCWHRSGGFFQLLCSRRRTGFSTLGSPESSPSQLDGESMSPLGLGHSGDITLGMHMAHGHLRMRRDSCSPNTGGPSHQGQQRTKRMRTSFKHQQLRAMKQYFGINHNPDAKDLKQLAQKTGLTKRVLQVWFQNARAKYRRSLLKQEGASGRLSSCGTESESPLRSEQSPCNSSRLDSGRCQEDHSPCSCPSSYVSPVGDHLAKDAASENPASGHYTDALPHSDYY